MIPWYDFRLLAPPGQPTRVKPCVETPSAVFRSVRAATSSTFGRTHGSNPVGNARRAPCEAKFSLVD